MNRDWLQLPDTAGYIPPRHHHRRLTLAVLIGAAFLAGSLAGRTLASTPRPDAHAIPAPHPSDPPALVVGRQPDPERRTEASALASPSPLPRRKPERAGDQTAAGIASWFATGPDGLYAAAGPALRQRLGRYWRGAKVSVCTANGRCVSVRINDWCGCPGGRLIDLSDEAFARLAALSRGLIRVTVAA
jgi:hypothetical protein